MSLPFALPEPDGPASDLSAQLTQLIRAEIVLHAGRIPFQRFMDMALYTPNLGYYMNGLRKFGPAGDFVTAPEISPLFSQCVARQCAQILRACRDPILLEVGAGSGAMAADTLLELERLERLPQRYAILELSADLRARQRDTLRARAAHLLPRVDWLERLPERPIEGVVLANEVLDAMPVHRVILTPSGAKEQYVTWEQQRFVGCDGPLSDPALQPRIASLPAELPEHYQAEINLAADAWVRSFAPLLRRGALLLFDYGFPAHEFYHQQRAGGTLLCHYRHRAHPDPLILVGLQDITSHIDFTALAHAAHDSGLHVAGFTTQAYFLVATGIEQQHYGGDELSDSSNRSNMARWQLAQQIQRLTSPAEMGELFKVLALTQDLDIPLDGFSFIDHRARL